MKAKPYKPIGSLLQDSEAVPANQIVTYGLPSRKSQSYRSLRTTKPYNPIRSFLTDYKALQANQIAPDRSDGHRPEVQKISSHSHDHRSHEWRNQKKFQKRSSHRTIPDPTRSDGQTLKLKSLRAKAVPCTHKPPRAHKSLYAQSSIQSYAISRFTRKAVHCTHKSLRAHKSLTRKDVLTRTQ